MEDRFVAGGNIKRCRVWIFLEIIADRKIHVTFWFLDVEEIATLNETFLNNKFGEKMLNIYYIVVSCKEWIKMVT